jgi:3-hydroxyisobutyrate dehydrogenase-like beta-hydroxyacid dehydrogenase
MFPQCGYCQAGQITQAATLLKETLTAQICSRLLEGSVLTIDNDVDLAIDCGHHQRRSLGGSIGFLGLGRMGSAMATNLAVGGCRVIAYLRRPDRAAEIRALGVEPKFSIADLFDCDFVVSMLPDDGAVREAVFGKPGEAGLAAGLKPNAVHLSMSTIGTAAAGEFAEEHEKHGQCYVAAPVFGNPDAAQARELFIIAAGAGDPLERCRPLFELLGQRTFVIGSDPESANLVKLVGNAMMAATLEMLGEAFALVRKRSLDPAAVLDILTSTMFGSRIHKIYGAKIVAQRFVPSGFMLPLALKDVRLALAEAEGANVPMPSVSVVRDRMITGLAHGYSEFDWSALGLIAAEAAGIGDQADAE